MDVRFLSQIDEANLNIRSPKNFDMLVFSKTEDYLCYVEAVHLLQHEGVKRDCDFIRDSSVFKEKVFDEQISDESFLIKDQRATELFFVLDNTDYPEAILNADFVATARSWEDRSQDISMSVEIKVTYTSNNKYYRWTILFIVVLAVLALALLASLLCYCRQSMTYNRYANERRELKQQLIEVSDSAYTNFLLRESENMRRQSS